MVQGTGSDVGKSTFVAGLCRLARNRGLRVAPFKPQNMSNNAAVTTDSGEIGRAQAVQALASGIPAHSDMNPMLLKPEADTMSQVVVAGRVVGRLSGTEFLRGRQQYLPQIVSSFTRLVEANDYVFVEGAGSPAEINLREGDIANMGFAEHVDIPVCLLGDIDRGGVLAALVGTHALLENSEKNRIKGFVINKFRGSVALLEPGIQAVERETRWLSYGVLPWLSAAARLPSEDTVVQLDAKDARGEQLKIAAPMLSRMANFDDADPLKFQPGVDFQFVEPGRAIPQDTDVIILFGTKSTVAEMEFVRAQGWHHDIISHARAGGRVLGICGGYQMLGDTILDPDQRDGSQTQCEGLGLLNITTTMAGQKQVEQTRATSLRGEPVSAYEIHMGSSVGDDTSRPMFTLDDRTDGAQNSSGTVQGTYLHGVFTNDAYRHSWLDDIRQGTAGEIHYWGLVDTALNQLATEIESAIDVDTLFGHAAVPGG